jgi:hypothetical protein
VEGKPEARLQVESTAGSEQMREPITQILRELYRKIPEFKRRQDNYGLVEDSTDSQG